MVDGAFFEAKVFDLIQRQFAIDGVGSQASVRYEDLRPQRGRDIIVEATSPIALFGIAFEPPEDRPLLVYVECKSTGRQFGLSTKSFASNVGQNVASACHAFILVTNGHFSGNALYDFLSLMSEKEKKAWVVEGGRLEEIYWSLGEDCPFSVTRPMRDEINGVLCEHRLERLSRDYPQLGELTVTLLNNSGKRRAGRLLFQSTDSWRVGDGSAALQLGFDLKPYELFAHRFALTRDVPDRDEDLSIALEVGAKLARLHNPVEKLGRILFRAPFLGQDHHRAREGLASVLYAMDDRGTPESSRLHVLSITGPAGTGKSRLASELEQSLGKKTHVFRFVRYYLGGRNKDAMAKTVKAFKEEGIDLPPHTGEGETRDLIEAFLGMRVQTGRIPVLILDDLHLADDQACQTLLRLLRGQIDVHCNAVLILVGRSDYSHGNAAFSALLSLIGKIAPETPKAHAVLAEFDEESFLALVREILPAAPPAVIDTIQTLSGRIPQQVIQCVEWLLDMSAVRVKYRLASGVVDAELFNRRAETLPGSMTEVLANRFTVLGTEDGGEKAQLVLAAAALLGPDPSAHVFELAGTDGLRPALRLLQERRFLVRESDGSMRWQHESLLLHFRNWLLQDGEQAASKGIPYGYGSWNAWREQGWCWAQDAARSLMGHAEILGQMCVLDQGLIAAVSGDQERALNHWSRMLDEVSAIDNWSTANLKGEIHPYLRWAFESHFKVHGWSPMLPRLARAMTYIGGYSWSLADGIRAAKYGIRALREASAGTGIDLIGEELGLRVMVAHFHLDAGHTRFCQGEFMDLLARYDATDMGSQDQDVGFEIFNCLGMLYGYLNHRTLAEHYFFLAEQEAGRLGNKTLLAKLPGDRSLLYQFSDHGVWLELCAAATRANRADGTQRHLHHAELGDLLILLTQLAHVPELPDWDERMDWILSEIDAIEGSCRSVSYFSVMPRIQLLRAATLYVKATGGLQNQLADRALLARADREADIGVGIAQRRGIGFAPWALLNLRALIAWREDRHQDAAGYLATATEILHGDGLLFLGRADLSTPNQIVLANYVKILDYSDVQSQLNALLKRISSYDYPDLLGEERNRLATESATKLHALLAKEELGASLLLDKGTTPQLALVVWF